MEGRPVSGKPVPGQNGSYEKILKVLVENNCLLSAAMPSKLAYDVNRIGFDRAKHLAEDFSPSQLGRMGFLGIRRLAQLRRDNPELFRKVMKELEEVLR